VPLIEDIKSDIQTAKKMHLPRWAILPGIIIAFLCSWLFDYFGKLSMVLPVLNCIGVFGFLIALKWKLRKRTWFWGIMIFIAALHVPLILLIPWTTQWVPALAIAVIDSADFCVIVWVLAAVGKFMEEPSASEMPPHSR
jgi:chromate transport protein ChrA